MASRSNSAIARRDSPEVRTQLTARVPKTLHRALKEHCVRREVSIETFVELALREKLRRGSR